MKLPFAAKWTIEESDLIAMKNSANELLRSSCITTASGIRYYFKLYFHGSKDSSHGKLYILLAIELGKLKEVEAKCTIKVESANNYSQVFEHIYKKSHDSGKPFCDIKDLFDDQKGFIRDGKLELKVDGIFVFEKYESFTRASLPTTFGYDLWTNEESKDFNIIVDGKIIKVHKLVLATVSPVFDKMFKSPTEEVLKGQLTISDYDSTIVEWALKDIYGCRFDFMVTNFCDQLKSLIRFGNEYNIPYIKATYTRDFLHNGGKREELDGICDIDEIYNERDFYLSIKLRENDASKDYEIIADGRVIKVHKLILDSRSKKFAALFRTKLNEALENRLTIPDFSFDIVERAVNALYEKYNSSSINNDIFLLRFAYEYDFQFVKDVSELMLICRISASTVCQLANVATKTFSTKLQEKCIEFLMAAFESKTPLADVGILDESVALKVVQNSGLQIYDKDTALKLFRESLYQVVQTQK